MLSRLVMQCLLLLFAAIALQWPSAAGAQAEGGAARGFLWEATRGSERVLLLGAIHLGRAGSSATYGTERPALRDVQVVAFEANVFDAQASIAAAQRWAMYPDGAPGLEAHVDAATLARIEKAAADAGGGLAVCCRMKPWMVANTLVLLEAVRAGLNPAYGSEAQLYLFASSTGRQVVEIESVGEQLRLFDEAAAGVQLDYLRHTLEKIDSGTSRAEIERLVGAWEHGDDATMERLVDEMARGDRPAQRFVAERIILGRHPKMLAAIERFAGSGRLHLVAIGALHYFGPDGLLKLLRERGFAMKRLR